MLLFALSCEVVSSTELATAQIQPRYHISFFSDMTFLATAVLFQEDADLKIVTVDLAEGDYLNVEIGEESYPLLPTEVFSEQSGEQLLSVYSGSGTYDETMLHATFSLTRANADHAPGSVVARPASFLVAGLPDSWPKATALPLSWTPIDILPMGITTSSDCTISEGLDETLTEDPGEYTVAAVELDFNPVEYESCELSAYVTRKASGTLDVGFEKGEITSDFLVPASFTLTRE